MAPALERCAARFEGVADLGAHVERLAPELDRAARDARDVEEVVHEPRHLRHLAIHRLEERPAALGLEVAGLQHVQRGAHRRERVAQLVRERREELVLALVGPLDLLVEQAIVDRARRAPGDAFREPEVGARETPGRGAEREGERAAHAPARDEREDVDLAARRIGRGEPVADERLAVGDDEGALVVQELLEARALGPDVRRPGRDARRAFAADAAILVEQHHCREVGEGGGHERGGPLEQRIDVERARHDLCRFREEARAALRVLRDRARRLLAHQRHALVGTAPELRVELVELHQRLHLAAQHVRDHGRQDVIDRAEGIAARRVHLVGEGGDEDDRRMRGLAPRADELGRLEPVHARHVHVEQDHRRLIVEEPAQRLLARRGSDDVLVELLEDGAEDDALVEPVVDDQDVRALRTPRRREHLIRRIDRRELRAHRRRGAHRCSHAFSTASSWSRSTGFDR